MPRPDRRPLSPDELRVIGRFVEAVADGRYEAIAKATRACLLELERIRPGSVPTRSYQTVGEFGGQQMIIDMAENRGELTADSLQLAAIGISDCRLQVRRGGRP